jgi:hypothetical protein
MRKLRKATTAEVIAEFLKDEFYREEFHADRESFERLVFEADLTNEDENALRRALLFRRRGHLWREVPSDTQWWQVELETDDLSFIRVFPRAQWRKIAGKSYLLQDIAERIRTGHFSGKQRDFISSLRGLSHRLRSEHDHSAVILIGVDEKKPLTILEGNHRLTAALLAGPDVFSQRFRMLCGFSPNMLYSCWYETNLMNLWRYGVNRLRNLFYDRDADVNRVLRRIADASRTSAMDGCIHSVHAENVAESSK